MYAGTSIIGTSNTMRSDRSAKTTLPPSAESKIPANQDDTLMMGFELFDEKGKLNPRQVLFSAQTSPKIANSLFTATFRKLMQWRAEKWAEKHLKTLIRSSANGPPDTQTSLRQLLRHVKQQGSIKRTDLFQLSAAVMVLEDTEKLHESQRSADGQKTTFLTDARIINRNQTIANTLSELIKSAPDDAKLQEVFKGVSTEKITQWITQHIRKADGDALINRVEALKKNDISAHDAIAEIWNKNSKIPIASKLFKFQKDACESGFIEYCQGTPLSELGGKLDQLENFISNYEEEFLAIQKKYSPHQYEVMIEAKNRLIELIPLAQNFSHNKKYLENIEHQFKNRTFPKKDPDGEEAAKSRQKLSQAPLNTHSVVTTDSPKTNSSKHPSRPLKNQHAHEYFENLLDGLTPRLRNTAFYEFPRKAVESGFTDYCKGKPLSELLGKIEELEDFIKNNDKHFDYMENVLTPDRFNELMEKREALRDEIQEYKTSQEQLKRKTKPEKISDYSAVSLPDEASDEDIVKNSRQQLTEVNEWLKSYLPPSNDA